MSKDQKIKQKLLDMINKKTNKHWEKHSCRLFGGIGTVFLIYLPLRTIEQKDSTLVFIIFFTLVSYALGWLMDRRD